MYIFTTLLVIVKYLTRGSHREEAFFICHRSGDYSLSRWWEQEAVDVIAFQGGNQGERAMLGLSCLSLFSFRPSLHSINSTFHVQSESSLSSGFVA